MAGGPWFETVAVLDSDGPSTCTNTLADTVITSELFVKNFSDRQVWGVFNSDCSPNFLAWQILEIRERVSPPMNRFLFYAYF